MTDHPKEPRIAIIDAPRRGQRHGEKFEASLARIGPLIGCKKLGVTHNSVPPGKRAFPYHNHHANEELFIILKGEGEYRHGGAVWRINEGDVCAAPAGGVETAHQIINTGAGPLEYLAVSTMIDPEVVEYPDSGKFAALAIGEGRNFADAKLRTVGKAGDSLDYWHGE